MPSAACAVLVAFDGSDASLWSAAAACWRALKSATLTPLAAAAWVASMAFSIKAAVSTAEADMVAGGAARFARDRSGLSLSRLRFCPGEPVRADKSGWSGAI
jgi:hypothetical protein